MLTTRIPCEYLPNAVPSRRINLKIRRVQFHLIREVQRHEPILLAEILFTIHPTMETNQASPTNSSMAGIDCSSNLHLYWSQPAESRVGGSSQGSSCWSSGARFSSSNSRLAASISYLKKTNQSGISQKQIQKSSPEVKGTPGYGNKGIS